MDLIDWDTVDDWVYDWLCMINNAFDTAMKALTISPFDSTITAVDTALAAVEGVALVLVSMFFAIELCNEAMLLKIQSYEQVFKIFLRQYRTRIVRQMRSQIFCQIVQ